MLEEKQGSLCGLAVSWRGSRWGTREVGVSMGAMDLSVHGGGEVPAAFTLRGAWSLSKRVKDLT